MMRNIMAIYDKMSTVDCVVEALLDSGFEHRDISLMSGDFWNEQTTDPAASSSRLTGDMHRDHIMLKVRAGGDEAWLARDMICNSGPIDVREREATPDAGWITVSTPVPISQPVAGVRG